MKEEGMQMNKLLIKLSIIGFFLFIAIQAQEGIAVAESITYNTSYSNCYSIFRATSGGTVFSADLAGQTAFDYFADDAVVDDAIYFSGFHATYYYDSLSDLQLNVGTAIVADAITIKWEYFHYGLNTWVDIPNLTDNTSGFTVTGANTVEFPMPAYRYFFYINSVRHTWVRARISAVTNITEGGANQTTTAKTANGVVNISGYAEGSPLTTTELYNWIIANTPIPAERHANYFIFPCAINNAADSYWISSQEIILLGNASGLYIGNSLGKFVAGTVVGDYGATQGSIIMICHRTGGGTMTLSYAEFYGSYVCRGMYNDVESGYNPTSFLSIPSRQSIGGTKIGASIIMNHGYMSSTTEAKRFIGIGTPISTGAIADNTNFTDALMTGVTFAHLYSNSQTFRDVAMQITNQIITITGASSGRLAFTLINSTPVLPDADTGSAPYIWSSSITNNTDVNVFEFFTLNLKVIDATGSAISGAAVTVTDENGYNRTYEDSGETCTEELVFDETQATVSDGSVFSAGDYIRIGPEVMTVDSIAANVLTISRGQDGTVARETAADEKIYIRGDNTSTDASGDIEEQLLQARRFYYDSESGNTNGVESVDTFVYTVTINKTGYATTTIKYTMDRKREEIERLIGDGEQGGTVIYDSTIYDSTIY